MGKRSVLCVPFHHLGGPSLHDMNRKAEEQIQDLEPQGKVFDTVVMIRRRGEAANRKLPVTFVTLI